jgi:aminoglycoside 3-N-acetyltransferase
MSIADAVNRSPRPVTVDSLVRDLRALGLAAGSTVLVHSSLSALGWVNGGAQAVILALEAVLGRQGTLVMPTQSCDNSNPMVWCNPPVPEDWWAEIISTMPAWDSRLSPSAGMGVIPETFRTQPGSRRSPHPQHSFTARGPLARRICGRHPLDHSLGDSSPLGALYRQDARVLMLGTGWDSCTAFHLAEYRSTWPGKAEIDEFASIRRSGPGWRPGLPGWLRRIGRDDREWVRFRLVQISTDDFGRLGADFEAAAREGAAAAASTGAPGPAAAPEGAVPLLRRGRVGLADSRLVSLRALVDFAAAWLPRHRGGDGQPPAGTL